MMVGSRKKFKARQRRRTGVHEAFQEVLEELRAIERAIDRGFRQLLCSGAAKKVEHYSLEDSDCDYDVSTDPLEPEWLTECPAEGAQAEDVPMMAAVAALVDQAEQGTDSPVAPATAAACAADDEAPTATGHSFFGDISAIAGDSNETQQDTVTALGVTADPDDEALLELSSRLLDKVHTGSCSTCETADVSGDATTSYGDESETRENNNITEEERSLFEYVKEKNADVEEQDTVAAAGDAATRGEEAAVPDDEACLEFRASFRALDKANTGSCSTCEIADVSGDASTSYGDGSQLRDISMTEGERSFYEYVEEQNADVEQRGRGRERGRLLGTAAHRDSRHDERRKSRNDEEDEPSASSGRLRCTSRERRTASAKPNEFTWTIQIAEENEYYQMQLFSIFVLRHLEKLSRDIDDNIATGQVSSLGMSVMEYMAFDLDFFWEVLQLSLDKFKCNIDLTDALVEGRVLRLWKIFEPLMLDKVRRKANQVRDFIPVEVYVPSEASTDAEDNVIAEESDDELEWQYIS